MEVRKLSKDEMAFSEGFFSELDSCIDIVKECRATIRGTSSLARAEVEGRTPAVASHELGGVPRAAEESPQS